MPARPLLLCALVLCALAAPVFPSPAPGSLAGLLQEADRLRSSDRERFQTLMAQINALRSSATGAEREHIRYLAAYAYGIQGDYESAIDSARLLADSSENPAMQLRAVAFVANLHALMRDFTEAMRQLERALTLVDKVADSEVREHAWGVAAFIYNQTGQHALAKSYADRVLSTTTSGRARCFAGQSQQQALVNMGQSASDDRTLEESIALCASQGELVVANLTRVIMARKWALQGKRDAAIQLLRRYLPEALSTGYPQLISDFESMLAELEFSGGNLDGADRHAQAAIERGSGIVYSEPLVAAYLTRFKVAQARGDQRNALVHYISYAEADKAYLNEVKTRELAYQIVRHETLQQTQHIALLNQQNALLQLQQRVQQQSAQNSRLAIGLLVLLAAFIALWAYRTKRMQLSLRRMAETDALTGICNRHHFNLRAQRLLGQCERSGEEVALVMFDLDHFKAINDRYGHGAGDWVLRKVAEVCTPLCRDIDVFGRLGGEEFGVLLAGHDLRSARRMADDMRMRLASIDTSDSGEVFRVTASFGVTTSQFTGHDLSRLMSNADRMLYRAKRAGRNRVCVYEGQVSPTHAIPVRVVDDPPLQPEDAPPAAEAERGSALQISAQKLRNIATS